MDNKSLAEGFVTGFFVGMVITLLGMFGLFSRVDSPITLANASVAKCAVLENPELRKTVGTATYTVTFVDGEYEEIFCSTPTVE